MMFKSSLGLRIAAVVMAICGIEFWKAFALLQVLVVSPCSKSGQRLASKALPFFSSRDSAATWFGRDPAFRHCLSHVLHEK